MVEADGVAESGRPFRGWLSHATRSELVTLVLCCTQPDGSRHPQAKAVRGAVDDFATLVHRQVFVTWGTLRLPAGDTQFPP